MNVLLDTNIIYVIAGINTNPNFTEQTIKNMKNYGHKLYISTVSIAECVLRYRNDIFNVKKLINLIFILADQFVECSYLEFNYCEIKTILNAKFNQEIKQILDVWSEKKIRCESEFGGLFVYLVISSLCEQKAEKLNTVDQTAVPQFLSQAEACIMGKSDFYYNMFHKDLTYHYSKQTAKENYRLTLDAVDTLMNAMLEAVKSDTNIFDDIWWEEYIKKLETPSKKKNTKINESITNKVLHINLPKILAENEQFRGNKYFNNYLIHLAERMFRENASFDINDISDLSILGCLDSIPLPSSMLTLDNRVNNYLKSIHKDFDLQTVS